RTSISSPQSEFGGQKRVPLTQKTVPLTQKIELGTPNAFPSGRLSVSPARLGPPVIHKGGWGIRDTVFAGHPSPREIAPPSLMSELPGVQGDETYFVIQPLRRLQQKFHLHVLVRKDDPAPFGAIENACLEQGRNVAMDRFDVPTDAPGGFANRYRPCAAERFEEFPSLGGQHLPEQFRG